MSENIKFEDIPDKQISEYQDVNEVKVKVLEKLEQKHEEEKVKESVGISTQPDKAESVPKELPELIFRIGSKALSCEKFLLDEQESKTISKHLSNIIGAQNSKIYSIFIIIVIVISKIYTCMDAVKRVFKKKNELPVRDEKENIIPI